MKFWKENADMSLRFNLVLKEGLLRSEIILLAEKLCHAARFTLKRADRAAFGMHPSHIKPTFLQGLLEAFSLTILGCHLLCLAAELRLWIIHWNYCVFLFPLFSSIWSVHIKGMEGIRPKQGMRGWLIKHKQCDAVRMCLFKYLNCFVNLHEELCMVPPRVSAHPWINNASHILHHISLFIVDNKTSVFFLNEIWHMDQSPAPLLLELLLSLLDPVWEHQESAPRNENYSVHHALCLYLFVWKQLLSWNTVMILFSSGPSSGLMLLPEHMDELLPWWRC